MLTESLDTVLHENADGLVWILRGLLGKDENLRGLLGNCLGKSQILQVKK